MVNDMAEASTTSSGRLRISAPTESRLRTSSESLYSLATIGANGAKDATTGGDWLARDAGAATWDLKGRLLDNSTTSTSHSSMGLASGNKARWLEYVLPGALLMPLRLRMGEAVARMRDSLDLSPLAWQAARVLHSCGAGDTGAATVHAAPEPALSDDVVSVGARASCCLRPGVVPTATAPDACCDATSPASA